MHHENDVERASSLEKTTPSINKADCMVQAVVSVLQRPELVEQLRELRRNQLEQPGENLDIELERQNLESLFSAAGTDVTVSPRTLRQLSELDALLKDGETVLVGLSRGTSSEPAHIVHVQEPYYQPEIIQGDGAQMEWKGYRSSQEYVSQETIVQRLMEQGEIQVFVID